MSSSPYTIPNGPSSLSAVCGGEDVLELPRAWDESFAEDVGTFWCPPRGAVDVLDAPPSSLVFLRDYVSPSRPCIIRNAILDPHSKGGPLNLTLDDIMSQVSLGSGVTDSTMITVDVTPDGHGDCIRTVFPSTRKDEQDGDTTPNSNQPLHPQHELVFVYPKQVDMSLGCFRERLRRQEERFKLRRGSATVSPQHSYLDVNGLPPLPILVPQKERNNDSETKDTPRRDEIDDNSIVYYSMQNDCLRTPTSGNGDGMIGGSGSITNLAELFPSTIPWAAEAFGTPLEAVNLWMGNQCSVSSMHKDFYENLFYVASGTKVFCLCPPADVPFLDPKHVEYPIGQLEYSPPTTDDSSLSSSSSWGVVLPNGTDDVSDEQDESTLHLAPPSRTQWIYPDVSPLLYDENNNDETIKQRTQQQQQQQQQQQKQQKLLIQFPTLRHVHPIEVQVQAGELLYLPVLWFHRVTQTQETIGVNYWYDMRFDHPSWCYFNLLQQIKKVHKSPTTAAATAAAARAATTG